MTQDLSTRVHSLSSKIDKALAAEVAPGAPAPVLSGMAMSAFVAELLQSAVTAHRMHLASRSYAEHMALGDYYEAMPGLVDALAEAYQGKYGLIDIPLLENEFAGGINEVLRSQVDWVDANRDAVCDYRPLQNVIDEICAFYHQKLYLLDNLE